jgi:hypothetical protein
MLVIAEVVELELGAGGSVLWAGGSTVIPCDDVLGGLGVLGAVGVGRAGLAVFFVGGVGWCAGVFAGVVERLTVVPGGGVDVETLPVVPGGGVDVVVQLFGGGSGVVCWAGGTLVAVVQRGSPGPAGGVAARDVLAVGLAATAVVRTGVTGADAAIARPAATISDHPVKTIESASVVAMPANRARGDRRSLPDVSGRVTGQASGLLL